jgi:hypothetical protein
MQCRDIEEVVEQEGLAPLPEAARAHLAGCRHCQGFVADLAAIVSVANDLPAEVEPPARVWVSLRSQLEREGIIRKPAALPAENRFSWWHGFGGLFRGRALATATVGLLIAAAAVLQIRTDENVPVPPAAQAPGVALDSFGTTRVTLNDQEPVARGVILASTSPVDASLRENLQQIDDFIAECERRLKEEPQDELALEYLSSAYQQKAGLLSAMMDRGGSVN